MARARAGETERARAELIELVPLGAPGPSPRHRIFAYLVLGDLSRRDGDLVTAAEHYAEAGGGDRGPTALLPQQAVLLAAGMAHSAVAAGDLDEAARHLKSAWRSVAAFAVGPAMRSR